MEKTVNLFKKHQRSTSLSAILKRFEKKTEDEATLSKRELLRELDDTLKDLHYARACFESASEPEIVEACVYKIKSAEARYAYLLRKAKENGTIRHTFTF